MTATTRAKPRRRHGIAAIAASGLVLAATASFYLYAISIGSHGHGDTYPLEATFLSSNGLSTGASVLLAGVQVGTVTAITLDRTAMVSHVRFDLARAIRLPADSRLSIGSPGLTSANALMIQPGHSARMLKSGGMLTDTCEASSLEGQVSRYIFGNGGAATNCGG